MWQLASPPNTGRCGYMLVAAVLLPSCSPELQSPRDVCIEASSHTAPKGVDREGPRKEDARKEDPEPLEHDLITLFKPH